MQVRCCFGVYRVRQVYRYLEDVGGTGGTYYILTNCQKCH